MAPKALPSPASRSSWQWERMKAELEDEYHNPAKFEANCKGALLLLPPLVPALWL